MFRLVLRAGIVRNEAANWAASAIPNPNDGRRLLLLGVNLQSRNQMIRPVKVVLT